MEEITLHTTNKTSRILIGERLDHLTKYLPSSTKIVILSDSNIIKFYKHKLPNYPIIEIGTGEGIKNLNTIDYIMGQLIKLEADRTSFLVGIGGGIVCDIAGFAASIYMRGIRFGFVSTTLLSQVDASVGGKNGVNYEGYKNMVGVFNQPEFVICDTSMLSTLPREEYIGGYAEVIKHGCIRSTELFEFLEKNVSKALSYDESTIIYCVAQSVKIKASVVEHDEREKGERRILNFGHTFAHAIEKISTLPHGQAVAIGMNYASYISYKLGMITKNDYQRIRQLIINFQLPVNFSFDTETLLDAMRKDKKREGEDIHLILLSSIGNAIVKPVSYQQLKTFIHDLREHQ
ncbi:MAG: 3-dehydroquinate synthase [Bacteroidales bacterium]|nr:3-dehydroquinate synthase [Bacteroidales bacterium]